MMLTRLHLDRNDKRIIADTWQDVEPILDRNAELRGEPQPPRRRGDWGRHVASVPNVILLKWMQEEWARGNAGLRLNSPEFREMVARKLRDPDWKHLRTDK